MLAIAKGVRLLYNPMKSYYEELYSEQGGGICAVCPHKDRVHLITIEVDKPPALT
jgi:hypothetical protein